MRSYALSFGSVLLCVSSLSSLSGCSLGDNRDYQVAVPWTINGQIPNPTTCAEQGIARGRFEVRTRSGKQLKTLEANCADTIFLSDGYEYGGFLTTRAFEWERDYDYTLTMVNAAGAPVSSGGQGTFYVDYDYADIWELPFLDYLNPNGSVAGLSGEWSISNNPDIAAACTAFNVKTVRIEVASALDEQMQDVTQVAEAPCSAGRFVSPGKILASGDYLFRYVAVSDLGSVVQTGAPTAATVNGSSDVILPRQMFLAN